MQVNLGEALLDPGQHLLVPLNLQIGMQATLHQNACPPEFDGFADLVIDRVEIEDVAFLCLRAFQRPVERAKCAVFGAEVRVINVAVNDVGDDALGV